MEQIWNNPITPTTLASAISSTSATSCSITSGTYYPTTGNFRIQIDSELMEVTGVSGTTFTIVRGTENTTAATHSSGATVNIVATQAALLGLRSDVNQIGTYANLPATGMQAGDKYKCTDSYYEFIYNGSSWIPFLPGLTPGQAYLPQSSGWSFTNQGSSPAAAVYTTQGGITLSCAASSSNSDRAYMRTSISSPWTVDAGMFLNSGFGSVQYPEAGIVMYESGTGKFLTLGYQGTTGDLYVGAGTALSSGASSNILAITSMAFGGATWRWLQFSYASSAVTFRFSADGVNWIALYSVSVTTYFTSAPNTYGIYVNPRNGTYGIANWLLSWNERAASS